MVGSFDIVLIHAKELVVLQIALDILHAKLMVLCIVLGLLDGSYEVTCVSKIRISSKEYIR